MAGLNLSQSRIDKDQYRSYIGQDEAAVDTQTGTIEPWVKPNFRDQLVNICTGAVASDVTKDLFGAEVTG